MAFKDVFVVVSTRMTNKTLDFYTDASVSTLTFKNIVQSKACEDINTVSHD